MEIIPRFAGGHEERLAPLAEELIGFGPAVIVTTAVNAAVAVRKLTSRIPIVCAALADATELGLAASYAHPGGNVTGITPYVEGLPAKQLELAVEVTHDANKVGLLGNMNDPKAPPQVEELKKVAGEKGCGCWRVDQLWS